MDAEMSLDDIIKQKKFLLGGSEVKRGGMQGGHKSGALPKSTAPTQGKLGGGVKRGSIFKGNGPNLKRVALNSGNSIRKHGTSSDTTKLIVSNLDYGVTDSDIVELFTEFGPLKFAGVHYNKFGRSMGSADLVFQRRADAFKAMKQYNGVPLDGREMNIQLVTSVIPGTEGSNPQSRGLANQTRAQNGGVNYKQKSGAAKRAAKAARNQFSKEVPTAEELNAELDEYVKNKILPEYAV